MRYDYTTFTTKGRQNGLSSFLIRWKSWGVVGAVEYVGPIEEFLPLLSLGQLTHVGKRAVFGLGHYSIVDGHGEPLSK